MSRNPNIRVLAAPTAGVDIPVPEVLRYMGLGRAQPDARVAALAQEALGLFCAAARYAACALQVAVVIEGDEITLGALRLKSADLARNLAGCERAVLFVATAGMETERQRKRAAVTAQPLSLALDAVGTAAIECFCDLLCLRFAQEFPALSPRPRFSPGYGDLSIDAQRPLLDMLEAERLIGVALTDALLMLPQKSVSAIMGLAKNGCTFKTPDCAACGKQECAFRL